VPPKTESLLSDTSRWFSFEDNSSDEKIKSFKNNNGHCKKLCIDNYSRIIFEKNKSRNHVSECFQDVYINNSHRNFSTDCHQSTDSDEPCTNIITDKQLRENSHNNSEKIYNTDNKSKMLQSGVQYRRSGPKNTLTQQQTAVEATTGTQRNIQRFAFEPTIPLDCHKQNYERRELKLHTAPKLKTNAPKTKASSPLDLTKLK
jgi:hypothetical protein